MELTIHGAKIKVSKTFLSNGNYVELEVTSSWGGTIALALYGSAEQAAISGRIRPNAAGPDQRYAEPPTRNMPHA